MFPLRLVRELGENDDHAFYEHVYGVLSLLQPKTGCKELKKAKLFTIIVKVSIYNILYKACFILGSKWKF